MHGAPCPMPLPLEHFVCNTFLSLFLVLFVFLFIRTFLEFLFPAYIDNNFYKQSAIFHKSLAGIELTTTIRSALFVPFCGIVFLSCSTIFGIPSDAFCNFSWLTWPATYLQQGHGLSKKGITAMPPSRHHGRTKNELKMAARISINVKTLVDLLFN